MTLQATIKGSEPIEVTWFKEKKEVKNDEDITISHEQNIVALHISKMEPAHAGMYVCQIKNDAGMQECSAALSFLGQ